MCYDIKASLEAQLKRAERLGDLKAIDEIIEKLAPLTDLPLHHVSGFSHPEILIYTDRSPNYPEVATWGLVPSWVTHEEQLKKIWNSTLNARGETIFEKASFREAAKHNRCIIYIDGFYEHHHFKGKTYPYFIKNKNNEPLALAGLYTEYTNNKGGKMVTFTIVTTKGNSLLKRIHNNPKLEGPRMPFILSKEIENDWLNTEIGAELINQTLELIQEYPTDKLTAHTVNRIRGKSYLGNVPEISAHFEYEELEF
ncbi:SOS response-associated peptidase [Aurantibacter crassamenti]|uniref:SOS response-associated peptidase n=1 Tax=Aurantibacter crassamenti TaxID=1837375 RepID=UPI001939D768|nr:SOS response-associated peptidase [Aurantibacter crassamenti]MBM1107127.1 SOS response-associated peptidase [Aurantibacter crassamenti]